MLSEIHFTFSENMSTPQQYSTQTAVINTIIAHLNMLLKLSNTHSAASARCLNSWDALFNWNPAAGSDCNSSAFLRNWSQGFTVIWPWTASL